MAEKQIAISEEMNKIRLLYHTRCALVWQLKPETVCMSTVSILFLTFISIYFFSVHHIVVTNCQAFFARRRRMHRRKTNIKKEMLTFPRYNHHWTYSETNATWTSFYLWARSWEGVWFSSSVCIQTRVWVDVIRPIAMSRKSIVYLRSNEIMCIPLVAIQKRRASLFLFCKLGCVWAACVSCVVYVWRPRELNENKHNGT